MRQNKYIFLGIVLSLLNSCIDSYLPDDLEYNNSIYIEGFVSNDPGLNPRVRIIRSVPLDGSFDQNSFEKDYCVNDADVYLLCNDGTEYLFENTDPGEYTLSGQTFAGEPGKSYKLIIYFDGETFESDFEILSESPIIDNLTYKVEEEKINDDGLIAKGYKFLVSTHEASDEPCYFRWLVDVTYEYSIPHLSDYIWRGNILIPFDNQDVVHCWKSRSVKDIFISSTQGLIDNSIVEAPLHFESQYGYPLSECYSIHIYQLRISKETYQLWADLDKLINNTGGLYETQPFRIEGNVFCTSNEDIQVLGIFEVAGVSEDRKYFETPTEFPIKNSNCTLEEIGTLDFPWFALEENARVVLLDNKFYTSDITCFDCTFLGGTNEIPPFWEYNVREK